MFMKFLQKSTKNDFSLSLLTYWPANSSVKVLIALSIFLLFAQKKEKTVFLEFFNASLNFVLIKLNKTLETSITRVCNNHTKY